MASSSSRQSNPATDSRRSKTGPSPWRASYHREPTLAIGSRADGAVDRRIGGLAVYHPALTHRRFESAHERRAVDAGAPPEWLQDSAIVAGTGTRFEGSRVAS